LLCRRNRIRDSTCLRGHLGAHGTKFVRQSLRYGVNFAINPYELNAHERKPTDYHRDEDREDNQRHGPNYLKSVIGALKSMEPTIDIRHVRRMGIAVSGVNRDRAICLLLSGWETPDRSALILKMCHQTSPDSGLLASHVCILPLENKYSFPQILHSKTTIATYPVGIAFPSA